MSEVTAARALEALVSIAGNRNPHVNLLLRCAAMMPHSLYRTALGASQGTGGLQEPNLPRTTALTCPCRPQRSCIGAAPGNRMPGA